MIKKSRSEVIRDRLFLFCQEHHDVFCYKLEQFYNPKILQIDTLNIDSNFKYFYAKEKLQ